MMKHLPHVTSDESLLASVWALETSRLAALPVVSLVLLLLMFALPLDAGAADDAADGSDANAATAAPTPRDRIPSAANTSLHPLARHPAAFVAAIDASNPALAVTAVCVPYTLLR